MRWLGKFHRDNRGAISVLVLLTIWCFVALIAMLWNSSEYSVRRQHVQNAADAAAHSAAMWQSRTLNAISGQNMVISRDASAEAVWQASLETGGDPNHPDPRTGQNYPKSGTIYDELMRERNDAVAGKTRVRALQGRLKSLCAQIEDEYAVVNEALTTLQTNVGKGSFPNLQAQKDYENKLRQAREALDWVENTYLHGQPAAVSGQPGPPGPTGEGLMQLVDEWAINGIKEQAIFDLIVNYIDAVEMPILADFQAKTVPATAAAIDQIMQQHEQAVFDQEVSERDSAPEVIDQQVHRSPVARPVSPSNVEDFYNVDIKLGTTKQQRQNVPPDVIENGLAASGEVGAPVITAFEADGTAVDGLHNPVHTDTIRTSNRIVPYDTYPPGPIPYWMDALRHGLSQEYAIDPVSPNTVAHTWANGVEWIDATIWHPPMPVYPLGQKYWLNLTVPGGWGHLWLMPQERYLNDRIWRDQAALRAGFWVPLDKERNNNPGRPDLKTQIHKLQNLPPAPQIAPLPKTIPDNQPDSFGVIENINVLPTLTTPANSSGPFNSAVQLFNTHSRTYLQLTRELRRLLLTYTSIYEEFYVSFAAQYWDGAVDGARDRVEMGLADNGYFMILETYKLRYIPAWAQANMYATVREAVLNKIVEMNVLKLTLQLAGSAQASQLQGPAQSAVDILQSQVSQQKVTRTKSRPNS